PGCLGGFLHALGQVDFFFGSEQRNAPSFLQIQADYIITVERLLVAGVVGDVFFNPGQVKFKLVVFGKIEIQFEIQVTVQIGGIKNRILLLGFRARNNFNTGLEQVIHDVIEQGDITLCVRQNRENLIVA